MPTASETAIITKVKAVFSDMRAAELTDDSAAEKLAQAVIDAIKLAKVTTAASSGTWDVLLP